MTVTIVVYCFQVLPLTVGGWPSAEGLRPSDHIEIRRAEICRREGMHMSIMDLISVLSFGLAFFSVGYALGKDHSERK